MSLHLEKLYIEAKALIKWMYHLNYFLNATCRDIIVFDGGGIQESLLEIFFATCRDIIVFATLLSTLNHPSFPIYLGGT